MCQALLWVLYRNWFILSSEQPHEVDTIINLIFQITNCENQRECTEKKKSWECTHKFNKIKVLALLWFCKQSRSHQVTWRKEINTFWLPSTIQINFIFMISLVPTIILWGKHFIPILQVIKQRLWCSVSDWTSRWRSTRHVQQLSRVVAAC